MKILEKQFASRESLINYIKSISPWATGHVSNIMGGKEIALLSLNKIDPVNYGATRNYDDGKITKLSAYVHHGIISLNELRNYAIRYASDVNQVKQFLQQLGWRDFWQYSLIKTPQLVIIIIFKISPLNYPKR